MTDTLQDILERAEYMGGFEARIAELEKEAAQWQESCGQNYVRATEAALREEEKDRRIAELKKAHESIVASHRWTIKNLQGRIAKLEAALEKSAQECEYCAGRARKALEKGK